MLDGRYLGTMCLSEPHAGSSLADITTRAEPSEDGTYRITGTKMWISAGFGTMNSESPRVPAGAPPIRARTRCTMFSAISWSRGTSNTVLNFGEGICRRDPLEPRGAVGYLVGEPNQGLPQMFHMMNDARIGVGFLAAAIGSAGYLASIRYARERVQGRPADAKNATSAPIALIGHADVKRMLLAQKSYVEGALALCLYCAKLSDDLQSLEGPQRDRAALLIDVMTPIAKSWPAQWCLEANNLAIQVHGGYGYTTDFDVEQCYRDNRLNAIHEGTHGIQAQDLLGRKMVMRDGAGARLLLETMQSTISAAGRLGRPDLVNIGDSSTSDLARAMYHTIHEKLLTLPDDVTVMPAHGAGSSCGKNLSTELTSTIGDQRRTNRRCSR